MTELEEKSKHSPGVGKYDVVGFDEKRNKPPKGNYKLTSMRVLPTDEMQTIAKESPSHYNAVPLYKY